MIRVTASAPGRVNLIGDHTDHTGGLCLPIAIDRAITITGVGVPDSETVRLRSAEERGDAVIPLDVADPSNVAPAWARYVAGVICELRARTRDGGRGPAQLIGFDGEISSTLPAGTGLSSSAALEVATALALGASPDDRIALARLCQAAEHAARDVPTGLLDQLASICGVAGHAILIDCTAFTTTPVPLPPGDEIEWLVVDTGARALGSAYAERVAELVAAAAAIGPIRHATLESAESLDDARARRRVRHVVTENARVLAFAEAMGAGDVHTAGTLMNESHESLRADFESSTPLVDELVDELRRHPGVLGARITGGGWGGCVVALTRPGTLASPGRGALVAPELRGAAGAWTVTASAGAWVSRTEC